MTTFIQANSDDRDVLAVLLRDFYAEEHMTFGGDILAALEVLLGDAALGRVFLVREDSAIAGYFALTFNFSLERGGKTALLDELYIVPAFRRRGLGKAALHFAISWSRDKACTTLLLEVAHANPAAQALYAQLGFITLPRHFMAMQL